jgi:Flp pilus assembly pilin Flp
MYLASEPELTAERSRRMTSEVSDDVTTIFTRPSDRLVRSTDATHSIEGLHTAPASRSVGLPVLCPAPGVGCTEQGREVNTLTNFLTHLNAWMDASRKREEGQTMAEYGVVLAVITLGVVIALGVLSGAISDALNSVVGFL